MKLAWAATIHKAQGATYDSLHVDLGSGAFAAGQTYVAMSRVRSLYGLSLGSPIDKSHVIEFPKIVQDFMAPESFESFDQGSYSKKVELERTALHVAKMKAVELEAAFQDRIIDLADEVPSIFVKLARRASLASHVLELELVFMRLLLASEEFEALSVRATFQERALEILENYSQDELVEIARARFVDFKFSLTTFSSSPPPVHKRLTRALHYPDLETWIDLLDSSSPIKAMWLEDELDFALSNSMRQGGHVTLLLFLDEAERQFPTFSR